MSEALEYPVILKPQSAELSHKSDTGGVIVGFQFPDAILSAWDKTQSSITNCKPGLERDVIRVESTGERGVELIIGAKSEPGHRRLGGVQAELYQDVRLRSSDLAVAAMFGHLRQLKGARLLTGFRGSAPDDLEALAEIISTIGRLMIGEPDSWEIDLNPVVVYPIGKGAACAGGADAGCGRVAHVCGI